MFDEHNNIESDLLMRSILEEGQESVPAHIWDDISGELDRISRRRKVISMVRRISVMTAAAAAVVLGVMLSHNTSEDIIPLTAERDMIAVVVPEVNSSEQDIFNGLIADAGRSLGTARNDIRDAGSNETQILSKDTERRDEGKGTQDADVSMRDSVPQTYFPDSWGEEDIKKNKVRTSLTVSGIAGTNNARNSVKAGMMKRPSITKAPQRTSIDETSTNTTYGIPLSFGAGVKIDFTPRWAIGVGVNYSLLTRKFYGTYYEVADGTLKGSTRSDIRNSQHYVGIPVNAFYNIINREHIDFYAYAGGTIEKCVSDNYQVLSTSIVHKEQVKGVQLSANLGIGVEFTLGKHLGVYIDPSLRYYFDCDQPKNIRSAHPLMLGFEIGLRAKL